MCGLAHYIEDGGIPTVIISLVKKHTEVMKPPRALHVPFELGRPFGGANKPEFQRKVLLTALKLLERTDGPILENFNENVPISPDEIDAQEGWSCPVNLPNPVSTDNFTSGIMNEISLLQPWYDHSLKEMKGRKLDGLTSLNKDQIVKFLVDWTNDHNIKSRIEGESIIRALKLAADDLRHFYYQAAMGKPGIRSDLEMGDWFYGQTTAGLLFIEIRKIMMESDDEITKMAGRTNYVPNAMLKHIENK